MDYRIPDPNVGVLDRRKATDDVSEHFQDRIEMLNDMVDYGTQLLPRCISSAAKPLEVPDVVVLGMLTRQFLSILDATQILLSQGASYAAWLQLRAMFEVSVYVEWILVRDTDRRANAFYVGHLRDRKKWILRIEDGSRERADFELEMGDLLKPDLAITAEMRASALQQKAEIDALLASESYRDLDAKFEKVRGRSRYDPAWYAIFQSKSDPRASLRTLCSELSRLPAYRLIYERGSGVMHATAAGKEIEIVQGGMTIRDLRHLSDFGLVWSFTAGETIHLYRRLLGHFRPEEDFTKVYETRWQSLYLRSFDVKYSED